MLDNNNIMTAKASEVVQKVPTDEKDYYKKMLLVGYGFHIATPYSEEKVGC